MMHQLNRSAVRVAFGGAIVFLSVLAAPLLVKRTSVPPRSAPTESSESNLSLEVIIPAYLEHGVIGKSIQSLKRQLEHWPGPSSVTIAASDDKTAQSSIGADQIYHLRPAGKPAAIDHAVERSDADIVVLTDANCIVHPDNWPELLHRALGHADLVSGRKSELKGREEGYWKYEQLVGPGHAAHPSLAVVGEFLALRRRLFEPVPARTQLDDFWLARSFLTRGHRVVVDPQISTTELPEPIREQLERRIRIASGFYSEVIPHLFGLVRTPEGRAYVLHKPLRMTVGAGAFWVSVCGVALSKPPLSVGIALGSVISCMGMYMKGVSRPRVVSMLATGVALQTIPPAGLWRAVQRLRNGRQPGWKKVPR